MKVSGGVKIYSDAVAMILACASRLGTSSGADIAAGKTDENACVKCVNCYGASPTDNVTIIKTIIKLEYMEFHKKLLRMVGAKGLISGIKEADAMVIREEKKLLNIKYDA